MSDADNRQRSANARRYPYRLVATMTSPISDTQRLETVASAEPVDGRPLGSGYVLDYQIGQGACGHVWRGRHRGDGTPVAIKVLRQEYVGDPDVVTRILRERSTLQGLSHPYLVPIEDLVVEGDTVAVVMELVDGEDLRRVTRRGWLDRDGALILLAQVTHALAFIHAAGVLHRDIKPENIMVIRREGQPWARLADFGLAWVGDGHQLTRTSHVVGTPAYLAPELVAGRSYGPAVDIYALGVTAYELLCGQLPFTADHPLALMRAHLYEEPRRPPGMADDHWQLIKACLAKQPGERPTAARLVSEFESLRGGGAGVRLGIAFGTSTTTAVLRWPEGRARPLLFDGSLLLPSAVCAESAGVVLTGRQALDAARTQPERCEPYPGLRLGDGTVRLGDQEVAAVDLVAAVLRRVAGQARRAVGRAPAQVTIAHPAGWSSARLALLERSARAAGLPSVRLVAETVAAAAHFVGSPADVAEDACAVIYDLGATTTTVSVVRRTADGGLDLLAAERLPDAGGVDIDAAIVDHLGRKISERAPSMWRRLCEPDNTHDRRAAWQLWQDVRNAKESLSEAATASVPIPLVGQTVSLSRRQINGLARPVLERTIAATETVLASAGITATEVTATLLVGGSSRMPLVATVLRQALGHEPTAVPRSELAIADGAAYLTPVGTAPAMSAGGLAHVLAAPRASDPKLWLSSDTGAPARAGPAADRSRHLRGRPGHGRAWSLRPRRRTLAVVAVLLLAVLVGLAYTLPSALARSAAAPACGYRIAYLGSLYNYGLGIHKGAGLAVEEYNAAHPRCTVEMVEYDTFNPATGFDEFARAHAETLVSDPRILGVVGPIFEPEVTLSMSVLDRAGVATILPSLHDVSYSRHAWRVFHRMVGNDLDSAAAVVRYLSQVLKDTKTFIVDDGTPIGLSESAEARRRLGAALAGSASINRLDADQSALIKRTAASGATTMYYAGLSETFGTLLKQLRTAAPNLRVVSGQDAFTDQVFTVAGEATNGVLWVCTCVPAGLTTGNFAARYWARYWARYKIVVPRYASEAYDAANVLLSGIAAGKATRGELLAWVNRYDGIGVSGHIKFKPNGDKSTATAWAYRIVDGQYVPQGRVPDDETPPAR